MRAHDRFLVHQGAHPSENAEIWVAQNTNQRSLREGTVTLTIKVRGRLMQVEMQPEEAGVLARQLRSCEVYGQDMYRGTDPIHGNAPLAPL